MFGTERRTRRGLLAVRCKKAAMWAMTGGRPCRRRRSSLQSGLASLVSRRAGTEMVIDDTPSARRSSKVFGCQGAVG